MTASKFAFVLALLTVASLPLHGQTLKRGAEIFDPRALLPVDTDLSYRRWWSEDFQIGGGILSVSNGKRAVYSDTQGLTEFYVFDAVALTFSATAGVAGNVSLIATLRDGNVLSSDTVIPAAANREYSITLNHVPYEKVLAIRCYFTSGEKSRMDVKNISLRLIPPTGNMKKVEMRTASGSISAERILIATNTSSEIFFDTRSAYLLQRLIYSGSGILLPVASEDASGIRAGSIVIGKLARDSNTDLAQTGVSPDGYAIISKNGRMTIAGQGTGTEYAVVRFFEKITSSIFVTETEMEPPLDPGKTLIVPEYSETHSPAFSLRLLLGGQKIGNTDMAVIANARCLLPDRMYAQQVHTIGGLVPYSVYGQAHPEYYALQKNGERLSPKNASYVLEGNGVHVCMANTEVRKIALKNMLSWMAANPEAKYFSLTFGDFEGRTCQCEECRKMQGDGNLSDRNLKFVNDIASEVKKAFPNNIIFTYAYIDTASPPTAVKTISDNIRILYCPYVKEIRNCYVFDTPANKKAIAELDQWTKLFPRQILIFDYPSNCPIRMQVWPGYYATRDRLRHYAKLGVDGIWFCGLSPEVPGVVAGYNSFHDLSRYVFSKMLWDMKTDVDETANDFLRLYFGPAGIFMKRYMEVLHQDVWERSLRCDTEQRQNQIMTPALSKTCSDIFAQAEKAVQSDSHYAQRVKKEKLYMLYSTLSDRSLASRSGIERELFARQLGEFIALMREFKFSTVGIRDVPDSEWFTLILGIRLPGTNWLYNPVADAIATNPVAALTSGFFAQPDAALAETPDKTNPSWTIAIKDMTGGEDYRPTVKCLRNGFNDKAQVQFRRPDNLVAKEAYLSMDIMSGLSGGLYSRIEILLNGKPVYRDNDSLKLSEETWRTVKIPLPVNDILPSGNQLTFTCLNGTWVLVRNIAIVSGEGNGKN